MQFKTFHLDLIEPINCEVKIYFKSNIRVSIFLTKTKVIQLIPNQRVNIDMFISDRLEFLLYQDKILTINNIGDATIEIIVPKPKYIYITER